jgi:hypothetical protein
MIETMKSSRAGLAGADHADRDASLYGSLWVVIAVLGVLATLFLAGCSASSAHSVDPSHARDALKIALDEWKKGEGPKSLQSSASPMTVQDFEWQSGAKLLDYQLIDDGKAQDANLRVQVKLTLASASGKGTPIEKKVWYLIGTSPSVTVFRDMLRR